MKLVQILKIFEYTLSKFVVIVVDDSILVFGEEIEKKRRGKDCQRVDEPRPGQSKTAIMEDNVKKVHYLVHHKPSIESS